MTDLAEGLVDRGIEITALAGRGRYNGGPTLERREIHKGVKIERAWATSFGKATLAGRLCDYLSFYMGAAIKLLILPRHDIVMVLTTPPLIGAVAVLIGWFKRTQVISLMQDIYPDVAIALGAVDKRSFLARCLDSLNRVVLNSSSRIIVLGECMRDRIIPKLALGRSDCVDVIHNWADGSTIKPLKIADNSFIRLNGFQDKFLVVFSGNLGQVNDFGTLLESARLLQERDDILFVFIGEGAKKSEIAEFAKVNNLKNLRMLPYQSREMLPHSITAAGTQVVTLAEGLAGLSVPSKTYGILAAGRPVLFIGDRASSAAKIVEHYDAGAVFASGESSRLAEVIAAWAANLEEVERLGCNARIAFETLFDRQNAIESYIRSFLRCASGAQAPEAPNEPEPRELLSTD